MLEPRDFALRIVVAFALGTIVGLERQWRQRTAGLRTNALVATGAALFASIQNLQPSRGDQTQIAAYIVSGVGFLAGAVIFRERANVTGLNTAATMWGTAAVGALCGLGFLIEATIGTAVVLAANVVLRPIVRRINRQPLEATEMVLAYRVRVVAAINEEDRIRGILLAAIRSTPLVLSSLSSVDADAERIEIIAVVATSGRADALLERIVTRLSSERAVTSVGWRAETEEAEPSPTLEES